MKVLGISSSPRKSQTEEALRMSLETFQSFADTTTTFYTLRAKPLHFCIHCNRCIRENLLYCPTYEDAMDALYPLVQEADVLVLASPVYNMAPNAQMMAMINRLRPLGKLLTKGLWASKVGISIAVGGVRNGGQESTLDILNNALLSLGVSVVSGGILAYNGGPIWSNHPDGTDELGLESVGFLSRRAYWSAKMMEQALHDHPDMLGSQLAGFADEHQMEERMIRFRK